MKLHAAALIFALVPAGAAFAAPGDTCTAGQDNTCTNATTLSFCDDTNAAAPVLAEFDCTQFDASTDCDTPACTGSACGDLGGPTCMGASTGDRCVGFEPLTNADDTDDDSAFGVLCGGSDTCESQLVGQALVDTCVASLGDACGNADGSICVGTSMVICRATDDRTITLGTTFAIDCDLFGVPCGADPANGNIQGCIFEDAPAEGEGEGEVVAPAEGEGEDDDDDDDNNDRDDDETPAEPAPFCGSTDSTGALAFPALLFVGMALVRRRRA